MDPTAKDERRPQIEATSQAEDPEDDDSTLGPMPGLSDLGIDPEVAELLLPHLDSFVKWEVLRFLTGSPDTFATVEELARYTGRDETELKPSARALAGAGLLRQAEAHQSETGAGYAYSLTDDERLRRLTNHLVEGFLDDRLIRLAISSHILKAQRLSAGSPSTLRLSQS